MFIDTLELKEARKRIAEGQPPYQFLTRNPHVLPIFGPALEDPGERNRAIKEDRWAGTIEDAQRIARRLGTEVSQVSFLTEQLK
jgi:hypothetical protein